MRDSLFTFTEESAALSADGQVGKVVDLGKTYGNLGLATYPLYLNILVKASGATSGGSGDFQLITGTAITTDTPPIIASTGRVVVFKTETYLLAALAKDKFYSFALPYYQYKRYLSCWFDEIGTITALKVAAWLDTTPTDMTSYPDAQN